jgi:Ca2+-transporting ATPase
MEALRRMGQTVTRVRRNGKVQEAPADELVPGDIVLLEAGDMITADLRILEASRLQVDESALTGESLPVSKRTEPVEIDTPLDARHNMLFKGTAITAGSAEGVVTATGLATELGEISSLVAEIGEEETRLEYDLKGLGHRLIWLALFMGLFAGVSGMATGIQPLLILETAIALAIAAIPEGLPIVATIALAQGMLRMARRNALVKRLQAVETLGAVSVICTDKTGTLTENRITAAKIILYSQEIDIKGDGFFENGNRVDPLSIPALNNALRAVALCNNASLGPAEDRQADGIGDPLEIALLVAAAHGGIQRPRLLETLPESREEAFDSDLKMMATIHEDGSGYLIAVKGAPESIIGASRYIMTDSGVRPLTADDARLLNDQNDSLADQGYRVLGTAHRNVEMDTGRTYEDLVFLGLFGLVDPPRQDVPGAIDLCRKAGVRTVMVTGDQPVTARYVAVAVGLVDKEPIEVLTGKDIKEPAHLSPTEIERILKAPVLARVSPRQKLNVIDIYRKSGYVVAMTGDGVNDAPALKKADIGIAMGLRGTQVAREAAGIVLKDDAFPTIVTAIEQGRTIFANIRKFVKYLVSCNLSTFFTISFAFFLGLPLPVLPLQILYLNLVTDIFPALALGVGRSSPVLMSEPPRKATEPVLLRKDWLAIGFHGLLISLAVLTCFSLALYVFHIGRQEAVSISFLSLGFARMCHVFNMKEKKSSFLRNELTTNLYVWGALGLCALLLFITFCTPLAGVLHVVRPGITGWILIGAAGIVPLFVVQIINSAGKLKADHKD